MIQRVKKPCVSACCGFSRRKYLATAYARSGDSVPSSKPHLDGVMRPSTPFQLILLHRFTNKFNPIFRSRALIGVPDS